MHSAKILPVFVGALLIGTTAVASAQTRPYQNHHRSYAQRVMPHPGSWRDPYAGTVFEGVAPYSSANAPNPYAGTYWDGLVPY